MSSLNLDRLNSRQRDAVLHGDGPLLVLAGAGSGKTSTMAYRIAHLISRRHVPAASVLGLSFTNKAAAELRERVKDLLKKAGEKSATKGLTVTTFHSLCVRMLRAHGTKLGFREDFTILDRSDQKDILKGVLRRIRIDDRKFDLDVLLFEFGQAKNRLLSNEEAEHYFLEGKKLSTEYGIVAANAYPKYQDQLKVLNGMDFDDLLFHGVALLQNHNDVRAHYNALYRYILVDEYQDTNATQFGLLKLLTQRQQNLCVVGDDDQSIYAWRGADPTHILEFSRHFPAAQTITLDQNYRSTNTILEAANAVIKNNSKRHMKSLWSERGTGAAIQELILEDDRAEAEYVATEIERRAKETSRPWKDFAILYRSNVQARIFEEALRRYKIPYAIVGGYSFLDLKEVKDVLAYWRLVVNLSDESSLRRILNWPSRGIGKSSVESLSEYSFKNEISLLQALPKAAELAPRSAAGAAELYQLINNLRDELEACSPEPEPRVAWARKSLERIGVKRAIDEECEDPVQAAKKWENIEELLHSFGQKSGDDTESTATEGGAVPALRDFLSRLTLQAQEDEEEKKDEAGKKEKGNEVTLLTLHGAKGLEYPVVFLVGLEEGFLPHKRTIAEAQDFDEERRLCYVGITRARDELLLCRARNRIRYGKPVPRTKSRFLEEIPVSTLVRDDRSHGPDKTDSDEARQAHEQAVKDHLSNIRAMLKESAAKARI